jgi:hypothetical protein
MWLTATVKSPTVRGFQSAARAVLRRLMIESRRVFKRILRLVAGPLFASVVAGPALAAINVDGRLEEPEWRDAATFEDFLQVDPDTNAKPPYPTKARVVATPEGLAVGIEAVLPREMRVYGRSPRDSDRLDAEPIRVVVDFDGTGRTAYEFSISLSNSIRDGVFVNQNVYSTDWDGTWFHAVSEDDTAWYAELLIPWSVVPSERSTSEQRTIGIWIVRYIKKLGQGFAYPAVPPNRATFVSDFHKMQVKRYSSGALDWFPYASVSVDQLADSSKGRAGLDVAWKGAGGGQLTATINPDFGQVESDDLVVNFSAIETFFSEKRPFFTENQQLFDLRTTTSGRLVNTRRIGAAPDLGDAGSTDIIAAAKYTTTLGATDLGAFVALEDDTDDVDGRSYFVGRVRQRANKLTYGYLGTFADRPAIDRQAQVHAIDADWRPADGVRLQTMALASLIDAPQGRDGGAAFAILNYDRGGRISQEASLSWFDRNFTINDLGFLERANLQRFRSETVWYTRSFPDSSTRALTSWAAEVEARRSDVGDWLPIRAGVSHQIRFRDPSSLDAFCFYRSRGIDDLITRGSGAVKLPDRWDCGAEYQRQPSARWRFGSGVFVFQDGVRGGFTKEVYINPRIIFTPNLSTDISVNYWTSSDWFIYRSGLQQLASYAAEFARVRATLNWYPGRKQEVRARLQLVGIAARDGRGFSADPRGNLSRAAVVPGFRQGELGFQVRYRYELKPLSDLFVVYSRGGFAFEEGERGLGGLTSNVADNETADQFLVKLRYRF